MLRYNSTVQDSSEYEASNKQLFSRLELKLISKYAKLNNKPKEKKISALHESFLYKGINRFSSLRKSLDIPKIKVIRQLTNFKSRPREIKLLESLRLPKTPPEQFVSSPDFFYLKDSGEKKDDLKLLGYSHIITIFIGNTTVKHAYSDHFKSQVAIKTERRPNFEEKRYAMLKNELESMLSLQHKNLLRIFEYFLTDNEIHIIMEYDENGTLSELIANVSFLPEFVTQEMFTGLARGLRFCHKKSIFHRNITCDNIYIFGEMHLKLANFRLIKNCTKFIREPLGTLIYTAPEVYNRCYTSGFLADMWSMGYVLYVMLIGKYPYSIKQYKQLKNMSSAYALKPSKNVTITVEARLLLKSLLCIPSRRLPSQGFLKHPWFDALLYPKDRFTKEEIKKFRNMEENEDTNVKKAQPKSATVKSKRKLERVLNKKIFLDSCFKNKNQQTSKKR